MQDFKHLTKKKRFTGFGLKTNCQENRRLEAAGENIPKAPEVPARTRTHGLKPFLHLFVLVTVLASFLALLFVYVPKATDRAKLWLQSGPTRTAEAAKPPTASSFETALDLLDTAVPAGELLTARTPNGDTLHYSIRGDLQKRTHDFMAAHKVPYGVFVAIDPPTGRILAMTSYSAIDPAWSDTAFHGTYPMASLFKIVTASAALENRKINPQTVIQFRGKAVSENPNYWETSPKGRNNSMDVTHAMGKSVNPVYGKIAADFAGKSSVMESVHKFGFNQNLLQGTAIKESSASEPRDHRELMLMGAGLNHDVKISPLHAASVIAAIANGGRMMAPRLTDRITTDRGAVHENQGPKEIRQIVSPETAAALTRMLSSTVTTGTSRKVFHDRRGKPKLNVDIAAKTGSIDGIAPKGHYSWFAAYAPANKPQIAVVALIINQDKWKIKSSQVGEQALQEFFRK